MAFGILEIGVHSVTDIAASCSLVDGEFFQGGRVGREDSLVGVGGLLRAESAVAGGGGGGAAGGGGGGVDMAL